MYQDRESIEIFKRLHERDRVREMARHIGEPSDDADVFAAHARAEVRDGQVSVRFSLALSAVIIAALFGALILSFESTAHSGVA